MNVETQRLSGTPVLCLFLVAAAAAGEEASPARPVAIVSSLSGTVLAASSPEEKKRTVRLFDWLPAGAVIETGSGSSLALALSDGRRYEMGEKARATITEKGLISTSGPVRQRPSVPPLPRVPEISKGAQPGPHAGAIRIRGERIKGLYPFSGSATRAAETTLRFAPVAGAGRYKVEIEDESGGGVFDAETQSPTVTVSPGVLRPGTRYYWKVRTLDKSGAVARGESEFVTLDAVNEKGRAALKEALEKAGDAASLALLAAIDRDLGLLSESREEFRAALAKSPDDTGLREALESVERQLATEVGPER